MAAGMRPSYQPTGLEKLCIIDLDNADAGAGLWAQYNPKEIGIDKSASWTPAEAIGSPELTFAKSNARTMTMELFFDTYETTEDVSVEFIAKLQALMQVMQPEGKEDKRRPPRVMVVWGEGQRFTGVVESVNTKFTMFLPNGRPVRATASIKMTEALRVKAPPPKKK